jgi:hypothetical protein
MVRGGMVSWPCWACDRTASGRCLDCNGKVTGTAWRCEEHRLASRRRSLKRYRDRTRKPRRPLNVLLVIQRQRRRRLSGTGGWANREKYLAYQASYNAKRAEQKRITERERYWRRVAA